MNDINIYMDCGAVGITDKGQNKRGYMYTQTAWKC